MNIRHFLYLPVTLLLFLSCGRQTYLADVHYESRRFDREYTGGTSPAADSIIAPYRAQMEQEMNEVLALSAIELTKGKPESTIGNFVCDLLAAKAKEYSGQEVDFAIQNYGGLRLGSIGAGPISLGKVYELMPFDNALVILDLKAGDVKRLTEYIAEGGGMPVSAGLRMGIRDRKPVDVTINGLPIQEDRTYRVAMNDYMANGGDNLDFLKELPRQELNIWIRDVIADWLRDLDTSGRALHPKLDGRIYLVKREE